MTAISPLLRAAGHLLSPGGERGKLTILTYHRVLPEADDLLSSDQVDARKFASHMAAIARHFTVLALPEALARLRSGTLPARALSITFDDGYLDNYTVALPILRQHGMKATFFICTGYLEDGIMFNDVIVESMRRTTKERLDLSWLGLGEQPLGDPSSRRTLAERVLRQVKYLPFNERESACSRLWETAQPQGERPRLMMSYDHVRELSSLGMVIGGHTHTHPILNRVGLPQARTDIEHNRALLRDLTGALPTVFAYPNGRPVSDYGLQHVDLVKSIGYEAAVSSAWGIATRRSDAWQLPRFSPWDTHGDRLVLRLLKNAMRGTKAPTALEETPLETGNPHAARERSRRA